MMTLVNNEDISGLDILLSSVGAINCTRGTIIAVVCQALRKINNIDFGLITVIVSHLIFIANTYRTVEILMADVALLSCANTHMIDGIINMTAQQYYGHSGLDRASFIRDIMARRLFMMPLSTIKYWVEKRNLLKNISLAQKRDMMDAAIKDVSYMHDIDKGNYLMLATL